MRPVSACRSRFSSWCPCTYISVCILGPARLSKRWIRGGDGLYGRGSGAAAAKKERGGSDLRPRVRGCSQGGITRNRSPGSVDKGTVLGRGLAEYVYLSKARLVDAGLYWPRVLPDVPDFVATYEACQRDKLYNQPSRGARVSRSLAGVRGRRGARWHRIAVALSRPL